jgi:hypothetical protein
MFLRVRIDTANLQARLSGMLGHPTDQAEVEAWLAEHGIRSLGPLSPFDFWASEDRLEALGPWEILERAPLLDLPPLDEPQQGISPS